MIEASYIEKKYRRSGVALFIRELRIAPGEIVGVLGANGSGKTTLLKAMMGLASLTSGELKVFGGQPEDHYAEMAFITEEGSYMPYMTPVAYGEFLADFFPRFDKTRYLELLTFYEIPLDRKLRTFSKGQKLKVEISAGLAKSARLIVMDEPFQGKDLLSRQAFIQLAVAQLRDDQTLVIATHLIGDIDNLIDRAIILHRGQLVADVQIDELREQGRTLPELLAEAAGGKERRRFPGLEDDK